VVAVARSEKSCDLPDIVCQAAGVTLAAASAWVDGGGNPETSAVLEIQKSVLSTSLGTNSNNAYEASFRNPIGSASARGGG